MTGTTRARLFLATLTFGVLLLGLAASSEAQFVIVRPPKLIPPNPEDFVSITAGDYHTCATKRNGNTYCWGLNNLGQVGTSNSSNCVNCVTQPRLVITGSTQVDAGRDHTCALNSVGVASCWGNSNYGQLGSGPGLYGWQPSPIPVYGGQSFSSISAGQSSTCGTTATGMFCWGAIVNGLYGQPIPSLVLSGNYYQNITVGYLHACSVYIVGDYRSADCFGNNRFGQQAIDPAQLPYTPPTVGTLFGKAVWRMATQGDYTCVDQANGSVQCAGYNGWGQLGSGSFTTTYQPQTVAGATSGVVTGPNHACALNAAAGLVCWGNGYWGQLGNGATAVFPTPQTVAGGRTYRAVAPGFLHTCAIGTDNQIYCWGSNTYGQLGSSWAGSWTSTPVQAVFPL
jgi:alpha-tubulin suppressor-like RCC1 family protein